MTQLSKIARWDKLKSWKVLRDEIEDRLNSADKFDDGITLEIGPQLLYTMRHPSALRCMEHTSSKLGEVFTCHYNKGAVQGVRVWLFESKGRDCVCRNKRFETECEITCMTYVSKHRVYLAFCSDLTLRVFTDARSNFAEIDCLPCLSTTLCLVYNKEDDEVYAGGIGFLEEWKIHGAEHAASLLPGRKFCTDLTRNDWIRDIKIVKQNNHIIAQHGNGLCVVHFKTRKQLHRLPNRHEGPLTCCCYYHQNDFLITGGSEGKIRVFNGTAFNLLHVFLGHHGPVTAMEPHKRDALLFSCSHDGTVRIWRMDSLQIFMRLDVGEKIYHMALLGEAEFFFQTEKNIMVYNCNQFYQFFAPVESETKRLMCCRGKDRPNRILASTEDGSVRLFSPITGLTLTIIYPMPSFQVLMSFAYDLHQDRLHTVLTGGKVLVYNTAANPCKAEEVWVPKCEDEHVNILLLVTVEFQCDDGTDLDNLVFAGLTNGQIILCDAVVCSLDSPVQAHEGEVTSLESCVHQSSVAQLGAEGTASLVISGGTDMYIKLWKILVDVDGRRPIVELSLLLKIFVQTIPVHITMYSNNLWVCIKTETKLGYRWKLVLHKLVQIYSSKTEASQVKKLLHGKYVLITRQITHPQDEDHTMELTSIDKCPIMNVVMTSGKDGLVKIWSSENELLREMNFATPIYASCFANDRGDILVGFGTHICSVSVVNYMPLEYLKQVTSISKFCLTDDIRELPVTFDNQTQPWLDISNLPAYSVDIFERRRQRLEEEVIERLKKATTKEESTKFVIFVDGKTTKVIRKDFADKLLNWARGKNKFKFGVKTAEVHSLLADARSDTENKSTEKLAVVKKNAFSAASVSAKRDSSLKEDKRVFFDSEGLLEIYPSTVGKALKELHHRKHLGPEGMRLLKEKELLKKDPIIAPDGYIPNSVIRRKLKPPKVDVPLRRVERPFKLKPVPKVNPQHMPSWWETEEDKERTTTSCWDDSLLSDSTEQMLGRSKPTSGTSDIQRTSSDLSETTLASKLGSKLKPGTPYKSSTPRSCLSSSNGSVKSKRLEMARADLGTPDSVRRGRRSGARSEGREKTLKLTNYAVDEDSSAIHVKESKSGRRLKSHMSHVIIKQLLEEAWMPDMDADFEYGDVINSLVTVLNNQNNPVVYDSACTYIVDLFQELGLTEEQLDQLVGKLGSNLDNINAAIKKYTLRTLQVLGKGRNDALMVILPKLVDGDEPIRRAAMEAIRVLTGATDKETLLTVLEEAGITSGTYNSKPDEEYTLAMLAEKFGEYEDPVLFDRIQNWVEGTTPGLFDEREDDDTLWQEGSRSRKELSFMSEGKSGKKDGPLTPRSKAAASSFKRRMKETDGFSTISDRSSSSRKSRRSGRFDSDQGMATPKASPSAQAPLDIRFTPKDPFLYRYYDGQNDGLSEKQFLKEFEPGLEPATDKIQDKDSDYRTISHIASSQITDRLSGYDSGIAKDMSEFSHGHAFARGYPHAPLSPVKSESASPAPLSSLQSPKDWRKFFDMVPNAQERKQMELIRREMEQGKLKHAALPPISYFAEDLPMLPGEAGTRLLQTVRVGENVQVPGDGRHRIESVPGKLAVHTQNEDAGLSNFGIIQMQWTTGVPTVKDRIHPPQQIPQHRSHKMIRSEDSELNSASGLHRMRHGLSEEELNLPYLDTASPALSHRYTTNQYEWEFPLPPPPAKESRTEVPQIRKDHESYCKYYQLVKKKLHLYTSQQKEKTSHLPELFVKRLRDQSKEETQTSGQMLKKKRSLTKTDLKSATIFPPIKIGQLVKIY